ncbi:MAG: hypothetical protein UR30_C0005G0005 [Candidatus Peregrinibacteria bacterium GW2011_GWC2_33_13]|nr:MAG: hypothetical protein UR30_C0005G0005 [Candidatus Peregrinibacteria bacterium GW2011_GWC2_33_13]
MYKHKDTYYSVGILSTHSVIRMSKTDKILELTSNKTKRTTLMFNPELWELFKTACEKDNTKPTPKMEKWILNYLDEKGLL